MPALKSAGWDEMLQIREEVYFTNGRIIVRGKLVSRGKAKKADFVLYYKPNIPIAIIEAKDTRADRPHTDAGLFNDYLQAMPGVGFSPHGARYAFATYGERDLGFKPGEGKLILDHLEGTEPNDVTGQFYSSDPGIARKRQMMRAWTDWCDEWAARAIADDSSLLDRDLMAGEIKRRRYERKTPQ
jgi:hypothetical protein